MFEWCQKYYCRQCYDSNIPNSCPLVWCEGRLKETGNAINETQIMTKEEIVQSASEMLAGQNRKSQMTREEAIKKCYDVWGNTAGEVVATFEALQLLKFEKEPKSNPYQKYGITKDNLAALNAAGFFIVPIEVVAKINVNETPTPIISSPHPVPLEDRIRDTKAACSDYILNAHNTDTKYEIKQLKSCLAEWPDD